jgi:hypothetical protein
MVPLAELESVTVNEVMAATLKTKNKKIKITLDDIECAHHVFQN